MYIQNQVEPAHLLAPADKQDHFKICKRQLVPKNADFFGSRNSSSLSLSVEKERKKGEGEDESSCEEEEEENHLVPVGMNSVQYIHVVLKRVVGMHLCILFRACFNCNFSDTITSLHLRQMVQQTTSTKRGDAYI